MLDKDFWGCHAVSLRTILEEQGETRKQTFKVISKFFDLSFYTVDISINLKSPHHPVNIHERVIVHVFNGFFQIPSKLLRIDHRNALKDLRSHPIVIYVFRILRPYFPQNQRFMFGNKGNRSFLRRFYFWGNGWQVVDQNYKLYKYLIQKPLNIGIQ